MNNLFSYRGLVDVRINASDKDLPVLSLMLLKENNLSKVTDTTFNVKEIAPS